MADKYSQSLKHKRLIDYVVVVGVRQPLLDKTQTPELLRRFPQKDHEDFPLPADVVFFCQPEACNTVCKKFSLREANSFVFTLTEKDSGKVRYGICMNIYRPCANFLTKESNGNDTKENCTFGKKRRKSGKYKRDVCMTLTSLCIVSHHPFFSTFRECLFFLRKVIDTRVGEEKFDKNDNFIPGLHSWSVLTCSEDPKKSPLAADVEDVETWIQRLLQAPAAIPGRTRVQVELLPPHSYPPLSFALPESYRFPLIDFPVHIPFELLGVETCLKVLTCILLEHKIVFQSRDYNALTMTIMALTKLMYPLEYMFPIIPLLPTCMNNAEQLLLAPTPYVIGVPASFFRYKSTGFQLPGDVWIVDLDSNKITVPLTADELPPLPEPEGSTLIRQLKKALQALSLSTQSIGNLKDSLTNNNIQPSDKITLEELDDDNFIFGNDVDAVDVAVRIAMIKFFMGANVAGKLSDHTRTLRLYSRPVVALQKASFLKSRLQPTEFAEALATSQALEYFAECNIFPTNTAYLKILKGIYDPMIIGDKSRWYAEHLETVHYRVYDEESIMCTEPWLDVDYEPSLIFDEEEVTPNNDEDDDSSSCYSSVSDHVAQMLSGDINGATPMGPQQPPFAPVRASSPLADIMVSFSTPDPVAWNGNFLTVPPQNADPSSIKIRPAHGGNVDVAPAMNDSATGSLSEDSYSLQDEDTEEIMYSVSNPPSPDMNKNKISTLGGDVSDSDQTVVSDSSSQISVSTAAGSNKEKANRILNNGTEAMMGLLSSIKKTTISMTSKPVSHNETNPPSSVNGYAKKMSDFSSQLSTKFSQTVQETEKTFFPFPGTRVSKTSLSGRTPLNKQSSLEKTIQSENQQFLKDLIRNVIRGDGIGWLNSKKLQRLMTDESLRQLVASRLYSAPSADRTTDLVEDTRVTRYVFKGMLDILRAVIIGFEHSVKNSCLGGVATAFQFLEIAHTHYYGRDIKESLLRGHDDDELSVTSNPESVSDLSSELTAHSEKEKRKGINGEFDHDSGHWETSDSCSEIETLMKPSNETDSAVSSDLSRSNSDTNSILQRRDSNLKPRIRRSFSETLVDVKSQREKEQNREKTKSPTLAHMKLGHSRNNSADLNNDRALLPVTPPSPVLRKSNLSKGYRYCNGDMIPVEDDPKRKSTGRRYLFEGLLRERSAIWSNMDFWESIYLDSVAAEREASGMDQGPAEMIERYKSLGPAEQKRLEEDEDRLLATMLYNLVAFMVVLDVNKTDIKRKVRRLLGKSHIGLLQSQQVNDLLDNLHNLSGNDIDLKPAGSRQMRKHSFVVHSGSTMNGDVYFMEVCDDCILLRAGTGAIVERWWYEKLVNITYAPKTKVLCIWARKGEDTLLSKFCTKKCKALYFCIKESMQRASERLRGKDNGPQLEGEFPIEDLSTSESGVLQVTLEGIGLKFSTRRVHIDLIHIRNCSTQKGVFVLDEYLPETQETIQHRFSSPMCNEICYAVLCLFSYVAASRNTPDPVISR